MKCTDVESLLLGVAAILAFGVKHAVSSQGRGKKQKAQRLHTGDYPVLGELLDICVFGWLASFVCLLITGATGTPHHTHQPGVFQDVRLQTAIS